MGKRQKGTEALYLGHIIRCPECNSILFRDAQFCPGCGSKNETVVAEPGITDNASFLVARNTECVSGHPLAHAMTKEYREAFKFCQYCGKRIFPDVIDD